MEDPFNIGFLATKVELSECHTVNVFSALLWAYYMPPKHTVANNVAVSIICMRIKRILVGDCDKEFAPKPPINRFGILAATCWACFLSASLESDDKRRP